MRASTVCFSCHSPPKPRSCGGLVKSLLVEFNFSHFRFCYKFCCIFLPRIWWHSYVKLLRFWKYLAVVHCRSCTLCQPVRVFSTHAFVESTCGASFVLGHNHMSSSIRVSFSRLFLLLVAFIIAHPAACIRSGGLCCRHAHACRGGVGLAETWRSLDCKFRFCSVARSWLTTRAMCMETQPRVRSASPPLFLKDEQLVAANGRFEPEHLPLWNRQWWSWCDIATSCCRSFKFFTIRVDA